MKELLPDSRIRAVADPFTVRSRYIDVETGGVKMSRPWADPELPAVQVGGLPRDDWGIYGSGDWWSGGSGGRTIVLGGPKYQIRQSGVITSGSYRTASLFSTSSAKLLIARKSGETWSVVSSSTMETVATADTEHTFTLASPLSCSVGDYVGVYLGGSGDGSQTVVATPDSDAISYVSNGDVSDGGDAIGSLLTDSTYNLHIAVDAKIPYLAVTGDSIVEGHNEGNWHSYLHSGNTIGGQESAEPGGVIRSLMGDDFRQQNHALGSTDFAWCLATGVPAAVASGAKAIWIHSGVNDQDNGRSYVDVEADLDAIRLLVPDATRLIITEILPWNGASDSSSTEIRTWNASIKAWCSANNVEWVSTYSEFGELRSSTGEYDNLKSAYDSGDGIHLSTAGVQKLAELVIETLYNGI